MLIATHFTTEMNGGGLCVRGFGRYGAYLYCNGTAGEGTAVDGAEGTLTETVSG